MRTPLKSCIALSAVVLVAFGAAGCGDDDSSSSDDNTTDTTATQSSTDDGATSGDDSATGEDAGGADDAASENVIEVGVEEGELKFDTEQIDAKAGKVTFKFTNPDSIPHDFRIEQDGDDIGGTKIISNGDSEEFTVDLEAGDYDFYCSPHKSAGMTGKLTVS